MAPSLPGHREPDRDSIAKQPCLAKDEDAAILLSARITGIRKDAYMGLATPEQQDLTRQQCIKTVLDWLKNQ